MVCMRDVCAGRRSAMADLWLRVTGVNLSRPAMRREAGGGPRPRVSILLGQI